MDKMNLLSIHEENWNIFGIYYINPRSPIILYENILCPQKAYVQ